MMGIRENFQKLIAKKQEEIDSLQVQIREANVYIQALQDSMKLLPKDGNGGADYTLRAGTDLAKARDVLKAFGAPMPVAEIVKALGKPNDIKHRTSLAGTLSAYARDGKVFSKTAPNTFGLLDFSNSSPDEKQESEGVAQSPLIKKVG
jgi:hypothetical protein